MPLGNRWRNKTVWCHWVFQEERKTRKSTSLNYAQHNSTIVQNLIVAYFLISISFVSDVGPRLLNSSLENWKFVMCGKKRQASHFDIFQSMMIIIMQLYDKYHLAATKRNGNLMPVWICGSHRISPHTEEDGSSCSSIKRGEINRPSLWSIKHKWPQQHFCKWK